MSYAWTYAVIGELDESFRYLENAYEERSTMCISAWSFEMFDPLRSDPRFDSFLARMNFPATAVRPVAAKPSSWA